MKLIQVRCPVCGTISGASRGDKTKVCPSCKKEFLVK